MHEIKVYNAQNKDMGLIKVNSFEIAKSLALSVEFYQILEY